MTQVCAHILGNNAAIAFAGSQGHFELNVYNPMMAYNFLHALRLHLVRQTQFLLAVDRPLLHERPVIFWRRHP
jgi:fumarate hydratase class II